MALPDSGQNGSTGCKDFHMYGWNRRTFALGGYKNRFAHVRTWEFSSTFIWNPCMAKALCRTRACKAGKEGNVVFRLKAAQTHACAWVTLPTTNEIPRTWVEELDRILSAPTLLIRRIGNQSHGSARTNVTADTLPPTALRVIT